MQAQSIQTYPAISALQAKEWLSNLNLVQNLENALFLVVQSAVIHQNGTPASQSQKNHHCLQKKQHGQKHNPAKRSDPYKSTTDTADIEAQHPNKITTPETKPVPTYFLNLISKFLNISTTFDPLQHIDSLIKIQLSLSRIMNAVDQLSGGLISMNEVCNINKSTSID